MFNIIINIIICVIISFTILNFKKEILYKILPSYYINDLRTQMLKKCEKRNYKRIIFVGCTGSGKSTLINCLACHNIAEVSSTSDSCTFKTNTYEDYCNRWTFVDTVGINVSKKDKLDKFSILNEFIEFIKTQREGFNCALFCIDSTRENNDAEYTIKTFDKLLSKKIPRIYVKTKVDFKDLNNWVDNHCDEIMKKYNDIGFSKVIATSIPDTDDKSNNDYPPNYSMKRKKETYDILTNIIDRYQEKEMLWTTREEVISIFRRVIIYLNEVFKWKIDVDKHVNNFCKIIDDGLKGVGNFLKDFFYNEEVINMVFSEAIYYFSNK